MGPLSFRGRIPVEAVVAQWQSPQSDLILEFRGEYERLSGLLHRVPWDDLKIGDKEVEVFGSRYLISVRRGEANNLTAITVAPRTITARPLAVFASEAPKVLRDDANAQEAIREELLHVTQVTVWKPLWLQTLMFADDGIAFLKDAYAGTQPAASAKVRRRTTVRV